MKLRDSSRYGPLVRSETPRSINDGAAWIHDRCLHRERNQPWFHSVYASGDLRHGVPELISLDEWGYPSSPGRLVGIAPPGAWAGMVPRRPFW